MTNPAVADVIDAPASEPGIAVSRVSVRFGGIVAVDDVTLEIPKGEVRGLIGPNGAGKTTLFDVMSGLRRPTTGQVYMHGQDVTGTSALARARMGLRRTFQRQQVFPWLSVEDNVLTASEWRQGGGGFLADAVRLPTAVRLERRRRERVSELLDRFQLSAVRKEPVGNLPIATVRLVELARALVDDPGVLLLDEPTSGLQPAECAKVSSVLRACRDEMGAAFVIVEHDIGFVLELCDRITVLQTGTVLMEGTPDEVSASPEVRRAYLG